MELTPPFTREEFLAASHGLTEDHNQPQARVKARASGLGTCARRQAYSARGGDPSDPAEHILTPMQGTYVEDLSCAVIEHLPYGLTVVDRQIELPEDYPVAGHPDGRLQMKDEIEPYLRDGLVWGFEHKHLGRFGYQKAFKEGFMIANPDYMAQVTMYADALGWDAVLIVVLAQDASATVYDYRMAGEAAWNNDPKNPRGNKTKNPTTYARNEWGLREDFDPKVQLFAYDLRQLKGYAAPPLHERARQIIELSATPERVKREYDPTKKNDGKTNNFPCFWRGGGSCPFYQQCLADGEGDVVVTPSPFGKIK